MAEENQNQNTEQINNETNEPSVNQHLLDKLDALQKDSVSKSKYNDLQNQYNNLIDKIYNGEPISRDASTEKESKSAEDLMNIIKADGVSNLDGFTALLELRKTQMDKGFPDPFLPKSSKNAVTKEDELAAERTAEAIQHCIDFSEGDDLLFTNELGRILR